MYLSSWNYLSTDEKVMAVCTILPPAPPVDTVLKVFESFETKSCSRGEVSLCHAEWVRCGCVGLSGDVVNSQRHAPLSRPTCVRCRSPPWLSILSGIFSRSVLLKRELGVSPAPTCPLCRHSTCDRFCASLRHTAAHSGLWRGSTKTIWSGRVEGRGVFEK